MMGHDPYRALYIHIPFCKRRCGYCDFATEAMPCESPAIDEYVDSLVLELRRAANEGKLACVETVYIGGGTPSHIGMRRLSKLLYTISTSMHLTHDVEFTMEANPESLTESMVKDLYALGVNRLSIGVQSLDDGILERLGRVHDADGARRAIETARMRFDNVSVDMMCGIPGQDSEVYARHLADVVELGASHVSVYPLAIEPHTLFDNMVASGEMVPMCEEDQAMQMNMAASILEPLGLSRYEVASYAKPGFACRHNIAYWTGKPYLGIGASAVTMTQNESRRMRVQDGHVQDDLDRRQICAEDLMLGMRMSQGISDDQVAEAALLLPTLPLVLRTLQERHLVVHRDGRYEPTLGGWLLGNEIYGALYELAP